MFNMFEDEDDIFTGSPRSKFLDVIFNANRDIAQGELARLIERMAAMEIMLEGEVDDEALEKAIRQVQFERADEVNEVAKNLYIESMGNVLSQSE